jgi:flagellar biosynthesis regulator FlaF
MTDLSDSMRAQLYSTGLTTRAVRERLGIKKHQAVAILRAAGAKQQTGTWRIPSLERNRKAWRIMERPACSTGRWKQ